MSAAWPVTLLVCLAASLSAQSSDRVLAVVNTKSDLSKKIGDLYAKRRGLSSAQICRIKTDTSEEIDRATYAREIAGPIAALLKRNGWVDRIHYIVLTQGVPLKIRGGRGANSDAASVDSELAALYTDIQTGKPHSPEGPLHNAYFGATEPFSHPKYPIYLVTRLSAYTFDQVAAMLERATHAVNRGVVVVDMKADDETSGNAWLRRTAASLPPGRSLLEETAVVVRGVADVIGYAGWGSNDRANRDRNLRIGWLPGAIATEYVSTDGRTFAQPPDSWQISNDWRSAAALFGESPQSLTADFIAQGATGASGHVYEPFLAFTPRPDLLFPAYLSGRNLAESFYAAIPAVSWMNIVVGDPLCRLKPGK